MKEKHYSVLSESCEQTMTTNKKKSRLCRFYGVSMDYIVGLNGERDKKCAK